MDLFGATPLTDYAASRKGAGTISWLYVSSRNILREGRFLFR